MRPISVLIVNEDISCRSIFHEIFKDIQGFNVVSTAPNGKLGIEKIPLFAPDIILVSTLLSDMNIKEFTHKALTISHDIGIIVTTYSNGSGSALNVIEALEAGAFDFVEIQGDCTKVKRDALHRQLIAKIGCFSIEHFSRKAKKITADKTGIGENPVLKEVKKEQISKTNKTIAKHSRKNIEALLIGVSTGGPKALTTLIPALPSSFPIPIIIVLHMPKNFTEPMARELNKKSGLTVQEAHDGNECATGNVYLAPGGTHLTVERGTKGRVILRTVDSPPENGCRPSVDVLFRSAANVFKGQAISVILTGMGNDGTKGLAELKKYDVPVIAQDRGTSVVWGMPGSAVKAGYVDDILPLDKIAERIIDIVDVQ